MPPCQDDTVDHSFHTLTAHKGLRTAAVWLLLVQASCLYKKLGRPNSQSRNYQQSSSHLSIRHLSSWPHKKVHLFGLAQSFSSADRLIYELSFQDHWTQPFKLSLHPFAMLTAPKAAEYTPGSRVSIFHPESHRARQGGHGAAVSPSFSLLSSSSFAQKE